MARQRSLRKTAQGRSRATVSAASAASAVKAIVMNAKEDKYLFPEGDKELQILAPTSGNKQCSVLGLATTSNMTTNGVTAMLYGGRGIFNMNMLRPMTVGQGAAYQGSIIDGNQIMPTLSRSFVQIERMHISMNSSNQGVPDPNLYRTLPIRFRVIRVTPKLAPGTSVSVDPTNDLFLNQYGVNYGVTAGTPVQPTPPAPPIPNTAFSQSDAEYAVINTRKYTVLDDNKFTLAHPPVIDTQVYINPTQNGLTITKPIINGDNHMKRLVFNHQLAAKKGGNVYFDQPTDPLTVNATSGHRREYVFVHAWYVCADGLPILNPPGGATVTVPGSPTADQDVKIHLRTVSKYKDV